MSTGADGKSHFEDAEMPMKNLSNGRCCFQQRKSGQHLFPELSPGHDGDWHYPSYRQCVINLDGKVDIVLEAGITRHFGPGDVFLANDMIEQGRIIHLVGSKPRKVVFVPLE